jgi:3-dehydrosphinganine reductase
MRPKSRHFEVPSRRPRRDVGRVTRACLAERPRSCTLPRTMSYYFPGKNVVITGGSSGIGLAFAKHVACEGATPILVARRADVLEQAKKDVLAAAPGARVELLPLDVASADDVLSKVGELAARERIDVLVNNAGVVLPGRFLELDLGEFRRMMDINYFGAVHMCRAVLPSMVERRAGHVLNVSSLAGVIGIYGYTPYAASKFALAGFSQALRAEMWPHGVGVSVCLPPDTDTPQLAFENQYKPAETRAIAGNASTLTAEQVAVAMAKGIEKGRFEIYPDLGSRFFALAQGIVPGVVRWVCDDAQKKAKSAS